MTTGTLRMCGCLKDDAPKIDYIDLDQYVQESQISAATEALKELQELMEALERFESNETELDRIIQKMYDVLLVLERFSCDSTDKKILRDIGKSIIDLTEIETVTTGTKQKLKQLIHALDNDSSLQQRVATKPEKGIWKAVFFGAMWIVGFLAALTWLCIIVTHVCLQLVQEEPEEDAMSKNLSDQIQD